MPSEPPSLPIIARNIRVPNIHWWSSRPRLPSGFSKLCSGPAPKPSSEIEKPPTRTLVILSSLQASGHKIAHATDFSLAVVATVSELLVCQGLYFLSGMHISVTLASRIRLLYAPILKGMAEPIEASLMNPVNPLGRATGGLDLRRRTTQPHRAGKPPVK